MDRIKVGIISSAVGLKGEVKVYPYTDYKERFEELDGVYINNDFTKIMGVRYMKNMAIIKFEGVDNRNQAELLREHLLYIDKKDLRELGEDEYYIFDLIGLKVVDEDNNKIGTLSDVIQNSAQDLYEIEQENGNKFLLPAVSEFIVNIDTKCGIMVVRLIEGIV